MDLNKIYQGHALEVLKTFPDEIVDCIITSPPYFNLRNYETTPMVWDGKPGCEHNWGEPIHTGQTSAQTKYKAAKDAFTQTCGQFCMKCGAWLGELGGEPSLHLFIKHLCDIFDEAKRVLKPTGVLFVVINDSYNNSTAVKTLPQKCMINVPARFAIEMTDNRGWIQRNLTIWHKPNALPQSVTDRFTHDYESVYFFSKESKYYFEQQLEEYTAPINRWGGQTVKGDGVSLWDEGTGQSTYTRPRDLRPNPDGRNMRTVVSINTESFPGAHFAVFPKKLVRPLLKAGCPEGGLVLDPFIGSGTVGIVAYEEDRNWIGIELNKEFRDLGNERIKKETNQAYNLLDI
jgi:site-specific DNA-methyltransferase (adenine-specific)